MRVAWLSTRHEATVRFCDAVSSTQTYKRVDGIVVRVSHTHSAPNSDVGNGQGG